MKRASSACEHLAEYRTLEECEHTKEHLSSYELELQERCRPRLSDTKLRKMGSWTKSASPLGPEVRIISQLRANKALEAVGDWDQCSYGIDRSQDFEGVKSTASMPSANARFRGGASKLARQMEYGFGRMWTQKAGGRGGRSNQVVDNKALSELMAELGL